MSLNFSLDVLTRREICGWCWDATQPAKRPQLVIFVNGKIEAVVSCSNFRQDLLDAEIGDGNYSFRHVFSRPSKDDDEVKVVCEGEILCCVNEGSKRGVQENNQNARAIFIDITDLIVWIKHHSKVSGIQRVMTSYITGLVTAGAWDNGYHLIFRWREDDDYQEIAINDFLQFLGASSSSDIHDRFKWVDEFLSAKSYTPKFRRNDVLFVLGAPWVFPDPATDIARTKQRYNLEVWMLAYDLIPIDFPEFCDIDLTRSFRECFTSLICVVDRFFAISDFVSNEVIKFAADKGVQLEQVDVLPMGADVVSESENFEQISSEVRDVADENFVLFVSTIEPRKNHALLFTVWKQLYARFGNQCPRLVFLGRKGWAVDDFMAALKRANWVSGRIVHLEGVSDAELAHLYQNCQFTIFPSFAEGWGLPISESLSYGKLCVASNTTSMPQASQGLCLSLDPYITDQWVSTLSRLIQNPEELEKHEENIKRNFKPMSWLNASQILSKKINFLAASPCQTKAGVCIEEGKLYKFTSSYIADQRGVIREGLFKGAIFPSSLMLIGGHWHRPEDFGVWSRTRTAGIRFKVPNELVGERVAVYITILAPYWYINTDIVFKQNGKPIGSTQIGYLRREVTYRLETIIETQDVELLLCANQLEPRPEGGQDDRLLGAGLKSMGMFKVGKGTSDKTAFLLEKLGVIDISTPVGSLTDATTELEHRNQRKGGGRRQLKLIEEKAPR